MTRGLARPLLASWFVYSGVRSALEPEERAATVDPIVQPVLREAGVDVSTADVVRGHGIATAVAASVLALSRAPRTAGLALTGLSVLTVASNTPFWNLPEGPERDAARDQFLKDLSLVGGVLLAASAGHTPRHKARKKARKVKAKAKAAEAKARRKAS